MGDCNRSATCAVSPARGIGLCFVALSLAVLAACGTPNPKPGDGTFGTSCDEDKDCESLICSGLDGEPKICTVSCTDPLGDECDPGFRCRRPDRDEGLVCVCTDPGGCEVDYPGEDCGLGDDCDDGVSCTEDSCDDGECEHVVRPDLCAVGSSCDPDEGCVENDPCTGAQECQEPSDPCQTLARCDSASGRCQYDLTDNDGDGHFPIECGGDDCDDFNVSIHRSASDVCDSIDNDCDGFFDEDGPTMCGSMSCTFGDCMCTGSMTDCSPFGGGCVDTQNDPSNCGGCGVTCAGGFSCTNGICLDINECALGTMCPPNSTCTNVPGRVECRCNAGFEPNSSSTECIDVNECTRGLANCGGGGCINLFGSFQCECPPGFQDLGVGLGCTDINECSNGFDCRHGGSCRNTSGSFNCLCQPGYAPHPTQRFCQLVDECRAGLLADFRWCDGACRDIRSDSRYCGSCFNSCFGDGFCENKSCQCGDESLTYCNSECVDTETNLQHCGFCYHDCPVGASCVSGTCRCPSGQVACNGQCVALGNNQNCLSCNDTCAIGATCTDNGCECPAASPLACNGICTNPQNDEQNCGDCFRWCPETATCSAGECQCPAEAPNFCENNFTCEDFDTSEYACGDCWNGCESICNEGACTYAVRFALGQSMGCVQFEDGNVGCFGSNENGRLGRGLSTALTSEPLGLLPLSNITTLAARSGHACALDGDGVLSCWGKNGSQQLGNGSTSDQASPVTTRTGVAAVAVGLAHTCVLLQGSGKVECIGSDASGQRGDGATVPALGAWTGPAMFPRVDQLASGDNHVCARVGGDVFCWGDNTSGQLGLGTSGAATSLNAPGAKVTGLSNVTAIAAGQNHTCAIAGGQVYCWGENSSSQCGSADTSDRLFATAITGVSTTSMIAAGDAHTCAVLNDGRVVCWGSGSDRQNGRLTTGPELRLIEGSWTNIALGSAHTCGVASGDFGCWGDGPSIINPTDTAIPVRLPR